MPLITDAANTWSAPVTLGADEIWQTRKGSVFVSTAASPGAADGIALHENHGVQISSGLTVRYRKEGSTEALIVREVV